MSKFPPTDPAAEIAYLKALEKQSWPDPAKPVKKAGKPAADWTKPTAADKKLARRGWVQENVKYAPFVQGGMTTAAILRALLIFGTLIALALLID